MEKIRMGLIGCGKMMRSHAQAVNNLSEKLEIVAVCDVIPENMEDVAQVLNDPYMTTDYKTMVDYVDAVLIALPHDLHFECGVFFARHKKHILMEKPLCNSEEECLRLIEVCEEEDVTLMCAYPVRYIPGVRKLKELVDSGEYGQIIQMSIWTEQLTITKETEWGSTARRGGGRFFGHGCHYVDVMLWFLGEPVRGMHFGTRNGTPWLLKEGTSTAVIQFENGALGYHGATWGARGTKLGYDYQIHTEKGMLEYDHFRGEVRFYSHHMEHDPGLVENSCPYQLIAKYPRGKQTQHEINHFVDCVLNHKRPLTDGRSALQGLRVIWKMYDAEKHDLVADLRGLGLGDNV